MGRATTCASASTSTCTGSRSRYYDRTQTGTLLSTITSDVATVQDFASSSTLGILVDLMTIVGMLGLMFWLDWDFTLIAVGGDAVPAAVRDALQEGGEGGDSARCASGRATIVAVVQQGLGSVRVGRGVRPAGPRGRRG